MPEDKRMLSVILCSRLHQVVTCFIFLLKCGQMRVSANIDPQEATKAHQGQQHSDEYRCYVDMIDIDILSCCFHIKTYSSIDGRIVS